MKVAFTCEECGHEVFVSSWVRARDGDRLKCLPPNTECPNCAKLTYGPLTEEMVAEALYRAHYPSETPVSELAVDLWRDEARFVLRLLNDLYPPGSHLPFPPPDGDKEDWRNWLLDLARQK